MPLAGQQNLSEQWTSEARLIEAPFIGEEKIMYNVGDCFSRFFG